MTRERPIMSVQRKRVRDLGRVIGAAPTRAHRDEVIGQRRELTREQLCVLAIAIAERSGARAILQVHDTDRRRADRRAQHGLDRVALHAAEIREAFVAVGRRGLDGAALADRARDDAARDRRSGSFRGPSHGVDDPARTGGRVLVVELEIRGGCGRDIHDQRERLIEQRLDFVLCAEVQEPPIERAFARVSPSRLGSFHHEYIIDEASLRHPR